MLWGKSPKNGTELGTGTTRLAHCVVPEPVLLELGEQFQVLTSYIRSSISLLVLDQSSNAWLGVANQF